MLPTTRVLGIITKMKNQLLPFQFNNTSQIIFGDGSSQNLAQNCRSAVENKNVLVVTDKGIHGLGFVDKVVSDLNAIVFDEVEADPSLKTVNKAIEVAKKNKAEAVVGFGGGSSMDVAKVVALIVGSWQDIDEAWGVNNAKHPRLPLVLVPTTAGTGSEVTTVAVITVSGIEKRGVVSPVILPDFAVLDPVLTKKLPAEITAATGVDAMVHAIEAFASASQNNNPMSRTLSVEALKLISPNIRTAVFEGDNMEARSAMLLGSMLAGMAFANSPCAAVHALAYPIGGMFGVTHGLSNALVLPHVLRFNAVNQEAAKMYAELARHTFPDLDQTEDTQGLCSAFIERLAELSREVGLKTRLKEVGIGEGDLSQMAKEAMKQTRLLVNNPREVSEQDAFDIYRAAL